MNRKIYLSVLGLSIIFVAGEGSNSLLKRQDSHEGTLETTSQEELPPEPKLLFPYFNGTEFWYNKHAWKYTTPGTTSTPTPVPSSSVQTPPDNPQPQGFFMGFAALPHYHGSSGHTAPSGLDYDYSDDASSPPKKIRPVRRRRPASPYQPVIVFKPPKNGIYPPHGMYPPPYNGWAPPYPMWGFKK